MSKLEVDAIEPQSGTTLTIGASGDTVNIASGATITDFTSTGIDDNATSTAITIDSSERVGIGRTPTTAPFEVAELGQAGAPLLRFVGNAGNGDYMRSSWVKSDNTTSIFFLDVQADTDVNIGTAQAIPFKFYTSLTERMRIDSSGAMLLNTTSSFDVGKLCIEYPLTNRGIAINCTSTSSSQQISFRNPNGIVGTIATSGSSTAFNTSSDHRLKENVNYDFDATTRLKQLRPARFNFIREADKTVDGFLAHEVSSIVPEAITGEKDATETKEKVVVNANGQVIAENIEQADWETGKIADEDGNTKYPTDSAWEATKVVPVYQGIDQAKLVPLLVKTIQELEARITTLENA
jgi:hypothetical protein